MSGDVHAGFCESRGARLLPATHLLVGFQYRDDAQVFQAALTNPLGQFGLELQSEKTRLLEFGRYATASRRRRSLGKPETFHFLGFTHICGRTRRGRFMVYRRTERCRRLRKLKALRDALQRRRHWSVADTGRWLRAVLVGHYRYYGVPGNYRALASFRYEVTLAWRRQLGRRSQRGRISWQRLNVYLARWLPTARIYHPYPNQRLCV